MRAGAIEEQLVERDSALERLRTALEAGRRADGALVCVEGPAGIGKTRMLEAGRDLARTLDMDVLTARGAEFERDHAYGIVRQLLARATAEESEDERAALLSGGANAGMRALDPFGDAPYPSTFAVLDGLYWLVSNLAARRPLLLVVDDGHWCDAPSARFLAYLARRLDGLALTVVVSVRTREGDPEGGPVAELLADPTAARLPLAPLTSRGVHALLTGRLEREPDAAFTAACAEATGGNPFLVGELATTLAGEGVPPTSGAVPRVRTLGPHGVARSIRLRIGRMPEPASALAAAVAVLGEAEPRHATALAGVEWPAAAAALDALADAAILVGEPTLRFVHPVVRSAVYDDLGPARRGVDHARAAALLEADDERPARVAPHLLHTEPAGDPSAVATLRAAAADAMQRGAPEVGARYLTRALEERPDDEASVRFELGRAEFLAGQRLDAACLQLERATRSLPTPDGRAEAALELSRATAMIAGVPAAFDVLERALYAFGNGAGELRARIETELLALGITHPDTAPRAEARLDALDDVTGDSPAERLALSVQAARPVRSGGTAAEAVDLCRRALGGGRLVADIGSDAIVYYQLPYHLALADAISEGRRALELAMADARARGSLWGMMAVAGTGAFLHFRAGAIHDCEADARQAFALGPPPFAQPFAAAQLVHPLVERGELDEAERLVEQAGCGPELPPLAHANHLFLARAELRLAHGRLAEALEDLLEFGRRAADLRWDNPANAWRARAAEVQVLLGQPAAATALADEQLTLARRWGAPSPIGVGLRARGRAARGEQGIADLEESVSVLAGSPARLEHARALVALGEALRRARRRAEAQGPLREGVTIARRCGALVLARQAHAELVAAGARPRRLMFSGVEALTPSERRVADLAASGCSNREIAQSLFVTAKTVENHLSRVYGKLDIGSRGELADALAA